MCGRYTLHQRVQSLKEHYNVKYVPRDLRNNYNVAPGQFMPVVTSEDGEPNLRIMKWGLVPAWAKDPKLDLRKIPTPSNTPPTRPASFSVVNDAIASLPPDKSTITSSLALSRGGEVLRKSSKIGYKLINARDDTIFTKPMWRSIILRQRCLIPADGFYEWKKVTIADKEQKQPFYIRPKHDDLFSFAGVWDVYKDVEGLERKTYSIITTSPNKEMADIHNRMPVILHPEDETSWLEPSVQSKENLEHFLRPYEDNGLEIYEVSRDVNAVWNNNVELTYPVDYQ